MFPKSFVRAVVSLLVVTAAVFILLFLGVVGVVPMRLFYEIVLYGVAVLSLVLSVACLWIVYWLVVQCGGGRSKGGDDRYL